MATASNWNPLIEDRTITKVQPDSARLGLGVLFQPRCYRKLLFPARDRNDRQFSRVREKGDVVTHVPVRCGRLARLKHLFPDCNLLILFYQLYAGIREWWNLVDIHPILLKKLLSTSPSQSHNLIRSISSSVNRSLVRS